MPPPSRTTCAASARPGSCTATRQRRALIYGIGTDICDIRRIAATFERQGDRFAERVLGEAELAIWRTRSARWPERGLRYLATRFSAKEAFSKAVGLGMRMPMTLAPVRDRSTSAAASRTSCCTAA